MKEQEVTQEVKPEYELNFDDLKPKQHNWIDRGLWLVCENAGHRSHRVFNRRNHKR